MKRFVAGVAVVSSLLLAPAARPQTVPVTNTYAFTAVDEVTVDHTSLSVTGVLEGEAAPTTREFDFSFSNYSSSHPYEQRQSCERLALAAMSRPGLFRFVVTVRSTSPSYPSCTLRRATP